MEFLVSGNVEICIIVSYLPLHKVSFLKLFVMSLIYKAGNIFYSLCFAKQASVVCCVFVSFLRRSPGCTINVSSSERVYVAFKRFFNEFFSARKSLHFSALRVQCKPLFIKIRQTCSQGSSLNLKTLWPGVFI